MVKEFSSFENEHHEPLSITSDGHKVHIKFSGETRSEMFTIFVMGSPAFMEPQQIPDGPGTFLLGGVKVQGVARDGLVNIHPTPEEYVRMETTDTPRSRRRNV